MTGITSAFALHHRSYFFNRYIMFTITRKFVVCRINQFATLGTFFLALAPRNERQKHGHPQLCGVGSLPGAS